MKLQFDANQLTSSTHCRLTDLFEGQPQGAPEYRSSGWATGVAYSPDRNDRTRHRQQSSLGGRAA